MIYIILILRHIYNIDLINDVNNKHWNIHTYLATQV